MTQTLFQVIVFIEKEYTNKQKKRINLKIMSKLWITQQIPTTAKPKFIFNPIHFILIQIFGTNLTQVTINNKHNTILNISETKICVWYENRTDAILVFISIYSLFVLIYKIKFIIELNEWKNGIGIERKRYQFKTVTYLNGTSLLIFITYFFVWTMRGGIGFTEAIIDTTLST